MKYFSTGFFLKNNVSAEEVVNQCLSWVSTSPHTSFIPAQLDMKVGEKEFEIENDREKIELVNFEDDKVLMYCFRYSKMSEPHKWITDIAVNKYSGDGRVWIQVESNVITHQAAFKAPDKKPPLIVMHLLDKFSGGIDDIFNVDVEPLIIGDTDDGLEMIASFMNAETENRLPIVYVSSKYYYREHAHNLIAGRLARRLSGLAHVVVEPEGSSFSNKLKFIVNSKNAYGGAVGIYWPRGQGISFHKRGEKTALDFEKDIFNEVIMATVLLSPLRKSGWNEIASCKTRRAIEKLKSEGDSSGGMVTLYEEDNLSLREELKELNQKISSYEARVKVLTDKSFTQGGLSLNLGEEYDLFDGEIKEVVLSSLKKSLLSCYEDGRFHHILSAIVSANVDAGELSDRDKKLKQTLVGYRGMTPKIRSSLADIGFTINEEGKHYKITYYEDTRYMYILSKTGSDYRGSLNAYSDITKKVFS